TPVSMSHTTVGKIIERVGEAQSNADKISVDELDIAATLPEGKKVDFLYTEADGVFVRGTNKRKHHEVYHGITYKDYNKNEKSMEHEAEDKSNADKISVNELDIAATLTEGKKVDFLYAEADGVFVRGTKKRKHHEVYHGITYEGWSKNGKRVSLINPQVMLT